MSQQPVQPIYYTPPPMQMASNGLGLAGFIVSLVSLFVCGGLISPIGLIMSLIALGRQPRGFAVAGVVLGLIGSIGMLVMIFVVGVGVVAAALGIGVAAALIVKLGQGPMHVNTAIAEYYDQNGQVPAAISELSTVSADDLKDPWGNALRYEPQPDGDSFYLISDGQDHTPDTKDDVEFWRKFGKHADFHLLVGPPKRTPSPGKSPY